VGVKIQVAALATASVLLAPSAGAAGTDGRGPAGQQLSVSATSGLDVKGSTVDVRGRGYDVEKGIYVAFCVVPAPGKVPTPCGGGADTSGGTGSSAWVSSNPPSYGKGLATPYESGGSFSVRLHISNKINDSTDCRKVACAVVTRADHTRTDDRSQDVFVPVTFASTSGSTLPWAIGGAGLLAAAAMGVVVLRRRRTSPS
jgi:hypothetical protein